MNPKMKELREKSMKLPLEPGVYIMHNSRKEIIYIGKAKKLKNRVSQYFGSQNNHNEKTKRMVWVTATLKYQKKSILAYQRRKSPTTAESL